MRVKIALKGDKIPNINKNRILSFLKMCINEADSNYFNKMFSKNMDFDYDSDSDKQPHFRPYVFGLALPKEKIVVEDEDVIIEDSISVKDIVFYLPSDSQLVVNISSLDEEFIKKVFFGALKLVKEKVGFPFSKDIILYPISVKFFQSVEIHGNYFYFRTLSPILLNNDVPINEQTIRLENLDKVNEKLNEISDNALINVRNMLNISGGGLYQELVLTPIKDCRDVFVKHTLRALREKTGLPYIILACLYGFYELSGDNRDLNILANIGLGRRRGQGFGYIELQKKDNLIQNFNQQELSLLRRNDEFICS